MFRLMRPSAVLHTKTQQQRPPSTYKKGPAQQQAPKFNIVEQHGTTKKSKDTCFA